MEDHHPRQVEDYTTASLVLIFINLLWIFGVIWANFGLISVIIAGWGLNHGITRLAEYRASREIQWPRQSGA